MKNILAVLMLFFQLIVSAQEEKNELSEAASNATNPLAFVTKLQLQPNFTWKDNDGRQVNLT